MPSRTDEKLGSLTTKIAETIQWLKTTSIDGCITGSALLDNVDFDLWESVPDIDVFCYSEAALIHGTTLLMCNQFVPSKSSFATETGEAEKIRWLITRGINKKGVLSTVRLERDGVKVNLTYKKGQDSVVDVISHFDMTIIMVGIDIQSDHYLDLRGKEKAIALPNPLRKVSPIHSQWEVWQWVRQFDRVIKYWNRGYDTRPMAEFYLKLIDEFTETGALFLTDTNQESYKEWVSKFADVRVKISQWIEGKAKEEL